MRIDHLQNPQGVVKRYTIPYGDGLCIEGQIRGLTEEGIDDVNWFVGEVRYPKYDCEIGGVKLDKLYQALNKGAEELGEVEKRLIAWCKSLGLEISDVVVETEGVIV